MRRFWPRDQPSLSRPCSKAIDAALGFRIVGKPHQHPHGAHASCRLRICRDRPARECAAEQGDELAPSHVDHGASPRFGPSAPAMTQVDEQPGCAGSAYHGGWAEILGTVLNCSEIEARAVGPSMCLLALTKIAHDDSLDGGAAQATRGYVRPARSLFSNALNFYRSAVVALVRSPCRVFPISVRIARAPTGRLLG